MEDALAALDRAPYLSLATFRRTGDAVPTPVWFAREADQLYVFSEADAGKVKRLRNSPRARVAACSVRGRVHGDWIDAEARIVSDPAVEERAYAALKRKYGWQMTLVDFFSRLSGRIDHRAVISIECSGPRS